MHRPVLSPDQVDHEIGIHTVGDALEGNVPLPGQAGVPRLPWHFSSQIAKDKGGWNVNVRPAWCLLWAVLAEPGRHLSYSSVKTFCSRKLPKGAMQCVHCHQHNSAALQLPSCGQRGLYMSDSLHAEPDPCSMMPGCW